MKRRKNKQIPFEFIFDHLETVNVYTKAMFGHTAVYVDDKMVMFLISKENNSDNGVCLATTEEHIFSLQEDFPSLTHLSAYGPKATDWRLIPESAPDFEETVVAACEAIVGRDHRIGRYPKRQRNKC